MNSNLKMYRAEIISNDQWHKSVVFLLGLIAVGLVIATEISGNPSFLFWVPYIIIAGLGTIIRLEVMVHRMGEFLKEQRDPWEQWRDKLKWDKALLSISDIACITPLLVALVAYMREASYEISVYHFTLYALIALLAIIWACTSTLARRRK